MEDDKRWKEQVGVLSEKTHNTYSTTDIERLIKGTAELFTIMRSAGYSDEEIWLVFFNKKRLGDKEQALKEALIRGDVLPTDSLSTIQKKMKPIMDRSRQSWGIAFNRLLDDGILV